MVRGYLCYNEFIIGKGGFGSFDTQRWRALVYILRHCRKAPSDFPFYCILEP